MEKEQGPTSMEKFLELLKGLAPQLPSREPVKKPNRRGTKRVYNFAKAKKRRKMAAASNRINRKRVKGWKH